MSEAVVGSDGNVKAKGYKRQTTFLYILAVLIYLLPIRFGASWLTGNLPSYPDSFLYSSLPTSFLNILAGSLLIYGIIIFKPTGLSRVSTLICGSWVILTFSCGVFGYFSENMEFYLNSVNQMVTVTFLALSTAIAMENNPRTKGFIIGGLCGGVIHTVLNGAYQYMWGFTDTQEFYRQQMAKGVNFPTGQVNRIMQKLVYSTFTISNSFAGHLLLTIPILILGWKKYFNKNHPYAVKSAALVLIFFGCSNAFSSSNVTLGLVVTFIGLIFFMKGDELPDNFYGYLGVLMVIVSLIILGLTRSRAGMVCFGGGLLVAGFLTAEKKLHKHVCLTGIIVGIVGSVILAPKVGSFQVRLGYYGALFKSFMTDVWGYGFGSFSNSYNLYKGAGVEESNVPHSFFFGYLGQGGIVAGLAVIFCFVITVYLIKRNQLDRLTKFCVLFGFSSWYFHAQLDFHIMIIGTLALVPVVALLCYTEQEKSSSSYKLVFMGLLPIIIAVMFFNFQKVMSERSYFYLYQTLRDIKTTPALDEVKNIVAKVDERESYSVRHLRESAGWAVGQYLYNEQINPIQKFEYLKFAEEGLLRSKEKYPLETGIYVTLARVYKLQDNYEESRKMLDKAFEVYPYSPSAIQLELEIVKEYRLRHPKDSRFHDVYLKNKLKSLEAHLGRLRFNEHLSLSSHQLNSIMNSLEKAANEIVTENHLISTAGIELDTTEVLQRVNEILEESRQLVK